MKRWIYSVVVFVMLGCTSNAPKLNKVNRLQDERAKELTQSASVANQFAKEYVAKLEPDVKPTGITNYNKAAAAVDLTGEFLRREQNLLGLPIQDQTLVVKSLLSENKKLREQAEATEVERTEEEVLWRVEKSKYEEKLLDMGAKYEAEHNKSILRRIYASLGLFGTVGVIVAICIFFPAAIPIFMRMVAWVVGKIPALASALGVVSKEAFDQVVRGVENGKAVIKKAKETNQQVDAAKVMDDELSKSMDQRHKVLVRARKAKIVAPLGS